MATPSPAPHPTTRAQAQALKDAGRPLTHSRTTESQKPMSPVKKPAPSPYQEITRVGPPRGFQKDRQNVKILTPRDVDATLSTQPKPFGGGSISDANGYVLRQPTFFQFMGLDSASFRYNCLDFASVVSLSLCLTPRRSGC